VIAANRRRGRHRTAPGRLLLIAAILLVGTAVIAGAFLHRQPTPAPPRNGWIAFSANGDAGDDLSGTAISRGADKDIYVVREGGPPRRIIGDADDNLNQLCPAFSPDGRQLAYVELDSRKLTPTAPPVPSGAPSATAEPSSVAAALADQLVWRIVVVDAAAIEAQVTVVAEIAALPTLRSCAEWSPDGRRLAYAAAPEPNGPYELHVVTLDGRDTPLTPTVDLVDAPNYTAVAATFAWAPDGSTMAFAGEERLWLLPVDRGGSARSVRVSGVQQVEWSPDGSRLAVAAGSDSAVVSLDGIATMGILERGGTDPAPAFAWSPDGRRVAYVEGDEIVIVDADGGGRNVHAAEIMRVIDPLGSADPPSVSIVQWSPDGQRLLCIAGGPDRPGSIVSAAAAADGHSVLMVGPTFAGPATTVSWQTAME
jgi:dipeptidyl aminopeptidase/acylaminoacyl peptidase